MERTCDYSICTGCGVCSTVCPKNCISFHTKEFGHIYPKIDTSKCIDCKRCERICPAINETPANHPQIAYAGLIKNEEDYLSTTSGGAAQALSLAILAKGGVVYGCASLSECRIEHIRVKSKEELELLKGSKYVQSKAWPVYADIIKDVNEGMEVLFIGTPCQCAGVQRLFKTPPHNLSTVELICHGVPSQDFLHKYFAKQGVNISRIGRIWFRSGDKYMITAVAKENSQLLYQSQPLWTQECKDVYYKTFINGYSFRSSCYTCKYASPNRVSDITIGDFWGLGKKAPDDEIPPHNSGISVILPTTEKGNRLLSDASAYISLYPRTVEEAISGNSQLRHPIKETADIGLFRFLRLIIGNYPAYQISFFLRRICKKITRKFS